MKLSERMISVIEQKIDLPAGNSLKELAFKCFYLHRDAELPEARPSEAQIESFRTFFTRQARRETPKSEGISYDAYEKQISEKVEPKLKKWAASHSFPTEIIVKKRKEFDEQKPQLVQEFGKLIEKYFIEKYGKAKFREGSLIGFGQNLVLDQQTGHILKQHVSFSVEA